MVSFSSLLFVGAISTAIAIPVPNPQISGPVLTTSTNHSPLRGFEGCSDKDREAVIDSFYEAQKILSATPISKVDFTSTAALDFFGPVGRNQDWQEDLQGVLQKASQIDSQWNGDDEATVYCRQNPKSSVDCMGELHAAVAVSNIAGFRGQTTKPFLTFCPQFFDYSRLDDAIQEGQKKQKEDIRSYDNRARHWIQALMLVDAVREPMNARNAAVMDIKMVFPNAPEKEFHYVMTPFATKLLARFNPERSSAPLAIRNAHNIAWFATAAYAESKVKGDNIILAPALDLDKDKAIAQSVVDRSGTSSGVNPGRSNTLDIKEAQYITATDYPAAYWDRVKQQTGK